MMKHATRHDRANVMKTINKYFENQITKLKKIIKKLKKMIEKTKNTILTFFLREINAPSKRKLNKKMKLMT